MNYQIFIPLIPFALGILLKILLDFNLAFFVVKYFSWVPVRNIFRAKSEKVSGDWIQIWENETSEKYKAHETRKSKLKIRQFDKYIYGEFRSNNDEEYYVFGEIIGKTIIGKWGDRESNLGYFGALELRIIDANNIKGIWLGHSNSEPEKINHNDWTWTR